MYAPPVDERFLAEIGSLPGGERVAQCIQCGSCSGSCPTAHWMDHSPRRIFALIRCGMRDEVLGSNTPWTCASCYTCYVRCPKDIKITDVMYALKRLAIKEGRTPRGVRAARVMAESFVANVHRFGRNWETGLMRSMYLRGARFGKLFRDLPLGMKLFRLGRMPLRPTRISPEGRAQLEKILNAVEETGGL